MRPVAALLAALLLASCSSPIPNPSIAGSQDELAGAYLLLVDASNVDTCAFNAALSQSAPALADLKRASADYADSLAALSRRLLDIDWPLPRLKADAGDLFDALSINLQHAQDMAAAGTLDAFIEADNQLIEANKVSSAVATQLRADLGLGAAGNPCS